MKHVFAKHKEYTKKSYYDLFLRSEHEGICECGAETTFRDAGRGYLEFCSRACFSNSEKTRTNMSLKASGKKQSALTIQKRIANTDQLKKEERRKATCLEKYGVENTSQIPDVATKISQGNKGKRQHRSIEHQLKIIESKRVNATLAHSQETRTKISIGLRLSSKFQLAAKNGSFVSTGAKSAARTLGGYFKGLHFRSSYELAFLIEMHLLNISVVSAETSEFACEYTLDDERKHSYYPDFFLPSSKTVIEIKPRSMLNNHIVKLKIAAAEAKFKKNIKVLTEYELLDITEIIKDPDISNHLEIIKNEHLCFKSKPNLGGKRLL